jgi:hypothetical protein
LALLVLPVIAWMTVRQILPGLEGVIAAELATHGIALKTAASFGLPVVMLVYAVVVVGWYSRLLEHDADLDACLTERGSFEPAAAVHPLWSEHRESAWRMAAPFAAAAAGGDSPGRGRTGFPGCISPALMVDRRGDRGRASDGPGSDRLDACLNEDCMRSGGCCLPLTGRLSQAEREFG